MVGASTSMVAGLPWEVGVHLADPANLGSVYDVVLLYPTGRVPGFASRLCILYRAAPCGHCRRPFHHRRAFVRR